MFVNYRESNVKEGALRNEKRSFFLVMGFSLLRTLEFFVFRKMENVRNIKPTCYAGGVKMLIAKNHLFVTIELFRHYRRKEKVI